MRALIASGSAVIGLALTAVPAHAGVNLLTNGGFQDALTGTGAQFSSGSRTLNANNTTGVSANNRIPGWTVTAGRVTIFQNAGQGAKGSSQYIQLSQLAGGFQGAISQTFSTVVGKVYQLVFYISRSTSSTSGLNATQLARVANPVATVSITGSADKNYTVKSSSAANPSAVWLRKVQYFKATSTSTTLSFFEAQDYTTRATAYAPLIDGVRVIATPEPEALGTMALGLGLVAWIGRRRRKTASAPKLA